MTLPTSGGQWPPASMKAVYSDIDYNDYWLAGKSERPTQMITGVTSGIVKNIQQRLFGVPGQAKGNQVHVPVPAAIARMSASLVFGEMFEVEFSDDDDSDDKVQGTIAATTYEALTKRANELLTDRVHAALLEGATLSSGHGGVYYRVSWDKEVEPNGAFISVRAADTAVPTFRFGRLVSVQFWDMLTDIAGQHYILLEEHARGTIAWGLYESGASNTLGKQVPLTTHPDAIHLATVQGGALVGLSMTIPTGSTMLTAAYMPNTMPNLALRKDPIGSQSGRSDFDQASDLFAMLDETMTSWDRDFRLGKTRVMVPKNMLKIGQAGQGASFDPDQELFVQTEQATVGAMNDPGNSGPMQVIQPTIRTTDHQAAAEYLFDRIYAATGYSAQSFGESGDMAKTATEVSNREKMTLKTRDAKVIIARPVMVDLISALLDVDYFVFPERGVNRLGLDPEITFPDAVSEDPATQATTLLTLTQAEAISIEQKVRERKPDWDDKAVADEVARIREDYQVASATEGAPTFDPTHPDDPETDAAVPSAPKDAPGATSAEVTK